MDEVADDVPNVLTVRVLVLLICTSTVNYDNGVSSMIVMFLFNSLKIDLSATKMNTGKLPAGGGARC